ncbi:hypothetical protein [Zavarzinella formosa]|uniref:hypothetical protein n=1 Tax=Zavarzinella formosa TaxID=360055 RepID=UPI000309E624|nr:hypothetical protein [Zavarzinella formosa]
MADDALPRFLERAKRERFFLASALAAFAEARGWDDLSLASHLACPEAMLTNLRLCRMPREDAEDFREDLEAIVARFPADMGRLAEVVRHSRVVWRLRDQGRPTDVGHLMAARQVDPPPEAPP